MSKDTAYTETRYYTLPTDSTSNQGYNELVKMNTEYNTGTNSNVSYVPTDLYEYFNYETFKETVKSNGDNMIVNMSRITTLESFRTSMTESNSKIREIYGDIDGHTSSNNYILDEHIATLAKKVTDYFVVSTALYGIIYCPHDLNQDSQTSLNGQDGIQITYSNYSDENFENLYTLYNTVIEELKLGDGEYSQNLSKNLELNREFNSNDESLSEKQDIFDSKKAFVITMMAKSHKANKLFAKKKIWFTIYLVLMVLYVAAFLGIIFATSSSMDMFNQFQSSMSGMVIVIVNAVVLLGLFLNEITRYFYK